MNLTCKQVTELLYDYLDGEMSCEQCACLDEHFRDCPSCEIFLRSYRETIRLTRSLPCDELPDELVGRLHQFLTRGCGEAAPPAG